MLPPRVTYALPSAKVHIAAGVIAAGALQCLSLWVSSAQSRAKTGHRLPPTSIGNQPLNTGTPKGYRLEHQEEKIRFEEVINHSAGLPNNQHCMLHF